MPPAFSRPASMFQIIFNELSAAELSALPKVLQLSLLSEFQILPEDLDRLDGSGQVRAHRARAAKNSTATARAITASTSSRARRA